VQGKAISLCKIMGSKKTYKIMGEFGAEISLNIFKLFNINFSRFHGIGQCLLNRIIITVDQL
jgi:hypothetical protein